MNPIQTDYYMVSHSKEKQETGQTGTCLLCSGKAHKLEEHFPGYQQPQTFTIYHCLQCNTTFPFPRVETNHIYESIYRNGEKVPGYSRYWHYLKAIKTSKNPLLFLSKKEEMYWAVRDALLKMNPKKEKKMIEVGCGLGYLTYSLVKENYDVIGLDISKNAVTQAIETFGDHYMCADVFEFSKEHQGEYDIVILTEVIEHLDEPIRFLESIMTMIKQGGKVMLTTPNKSAFPDEMSWATELPPVHLWWFTEDSMKFIASELNAKVSFTDFSSYYKKRPRLMEPQKFINNNPTLNSKGELINISMPNGKFHSLLAEVSLFRHLYLNAKSVFTKASLCKQRGPIMGVIFEKK